MAWPTSPRRSVTEACIAGHQVLYTSAHDMLTQLRASRADYSLDLGRFEAGEVTIFAQGAGPRAALAEPVLQAYSSRVRGLAWLSTMRATAAESTAPKRRACLMAATRSEVL